MAIHSTRCDFCGRGFTTQVWNQRTCVACAVAGAPDQSQLSGVAYQRALRRYLRSIGRLSALSGAAAKPGYLAVDPILPRRFASGSDVGREMTWDRLFRQRAKVPCVSRERVR